MHENCTVVPLNLYIFVVLGRTNRVHASFWYIFSLKAARAARIVRRSCLRCHILHAVSMTLHAPCMRCHWHLQNKAISPMNFPFRSCSNFTMNAISMTRNAPCTRCQWPRMHRACGVNYTALTKFSNKGPRGQDECFNEKNRGSKILYHCPFNSFFNFFCHTSTGNSCSPAYLCGWFL
jgi:hypothetical protein